MTSLKCGDLYATLMHKHFAHSSVGATTKKAKRNAPKKFPSYGIGMIDSKICSITPAGITTPAPRQKVIKISLAGSFSYLSLQ
jgi:hypothetical protein